MWTFTGDSFSGEKTAAELGMTKPVLSDGSTQVGEMKFSQVFKDAASVVRLDEGDKFTVFRNGIKFWQGWVTKVRIGGSTTGGFVLQVVVSDVWWWLMKTPLTGDAKGTDGGTLRERPLFGYAEGDLRTHIIATIDRAKSLGVDIDVGGISSMFSVPQITLKQISVAEAIIYLMRFIPDAMLWINHGATTPTINIKRRQYAAEVDLTEGEDPLDAYALEALWTLETSQIVVPYVSRNVNGLTIFEQQSAGTSSLGKRQIFPTSGPEMDSFLPYDPNDSYDAETESTNDLETIALALGIFDAAKANGLTTELTFGALTWTHYDTAALATSTSNPQYYSTPAAIYTTAEGEPFDMTGKYILKGGTPPAWAQAEHGLAQVFVRVTYSYAHNSEASGNPGVWIAPPAWHDDLPGVTTLHNGYTTGWYYTQLYGGEITFTIWVIDTEYASSSTLYKPADYDYVTPPANFATNMLATQDFTPYGGTLQMVRREVGEKEFRGKVYNITNALTEHATMKAMAQRRTLDFATGLTTIELGVPTRYRYQDLLTLKSRTASDNILWVVGNGYSPESDGSGGIPTIGSSGGSTSTDNGTGNTVYIGIGGGSGDLVEDQDDSQIPVSSVDYSFSRLPINHTVYVNLNSQTLAFTAMNTTAIQNTGWSMVTEIAVNGVYTELSSANIGGGADDRTLNINLGISYHGFNWIAASDDMTTPYTVEVKVRASIKDGSSNVIDSEEFYVVRQEGTLDNKDGPSQHATVSPTLPVTEVTLYASED